jgi:predicted ferric reductase
MNYKLMKVVQIVMGIYILLFTFTRLNPYWIQAGHTISNPDFPESNQMGLVQWPYTIRRLGTTSVFFIERPIIAETVPQMILLGISRFSAFYSYPAIVLVFWTKLRGLHSIIDKTPLSVLIISDTHKLHVYCGWVMFFDALLHTTAHLIRWGLQGNLYLLTSNKSWTGITGLIAVISICFVVLPMTVLKKFIKFEIRKYIHYLFWLLALVLTFHVPFAAFPNGGFCSFIFPVLMLSYALDAMYVKFFMSERITTPSYKVLNSGVELSMPVSDRFQKSLKSGGYGYVMLPWVSKHQWHAYSLYENPLDTSIRHMFLAKAGDWTSEVHTRVEEVDATARPLWITGPFPSPYNNAYNYDSMILVAAGIGITPALSCIESYKESRRVNLIWTVRDASMLVFFLENAKLDEKGLNFIFYTGKEELPETIENFNVSAHVKIIHKRPNLSILLPKIIAYFERRNTNTVPTNTVAVSKDKNSPTLKGVENGSGLSLDDNDKDVEQDVSLEQVLAPSTDAALEESVRESSKHRKTPGPRHSIWNTNSKHIVLSDEIDTLHDNDELWDEINKPRPIETSAQFVKTGMSNEKLEHWGFMYCGSRNPLLDSLVKESKTLKIPLHEEAFDW